MNRRRLLGWAVLTAGVARAEGLQTVALAHGFVFGEDRLRVLTPVLAQRQKQVQALRDFVVDDGVGPTAGVGE
jgi:hypothetical protein